MPTDRFWPLLATVGGWYLLGLSVTVALVVYPAFARVGTAEWFGYHRQHSSAIIRAVGPAWLVEGVATVGWLLQRASADGGGWLTVLALVHAVAAAVSVVLTVAGAVPRHQALAGGFDAVAHGRLLAVHRWRTAAWALAVVTATLGALA